MNIAIDWNKVNTAAMKQEGQVAQRLKEVVTEITQRRAVVDSAIAPLQDAIDLEEATDAELVALKAWKKYRVLLSRVSSQVGYPDAIDWPSPPA